MASEEAAKELLPSVMGWLQSEGDDHEENKDQILQDLKKILSNYDLDGYALARELDDWNPNAELVEILDHASVLISKAEKKLIRQFIEENDIKPRLSKGMEVNVPGRYLSGGFGRKNIERSKIYKGTIKSIETDGNYTVYSQEAGHVTAESGECGVTATYIPWRDLEDANKDLFLQPLQKSDIV